mmetsp:Transcript_44900/g.106564  ORF Transcript_44900/g.106564 Transcript_44900/m.106564 type:complete len:327 (+) Transcript_44900:87-1067(+)
MLPAGAFAAPGLYALRQEGHVGIQDFEQRWQKPFSLARVVHPLHPVRRGSLCRSRRELEAVPFTALDPALPPSRKSSSSSCRGKICTQAASVIQELIKGPDRLQVLMSLRASSVPPQVFFWLLLLAGIGVPVSEDVLAIYAGFILRKLSSQRRLEVILALYLGVVLSDWITYSIGRLAGKTLLSLSSAKEARQQERKVKKGRKQKLTRLERARALFQKSGSTIGFALRLAPGLRVPLLLLSGASKVRFWTTFVPYNLLGAFASLSVQLLIGALGGASPTLIQGGRMAVLLPCIGAVVLATVLVVSLKRSQKAPVDAVRESEAQNPS